MNDLKYTDLGNMTLAGRGRLSAPAPSAVAQPPDQTSPARAQDVPAPSAKPDSPDASQSAVAREKAQIEDERQALKEAVSHLNEYVQTVQRDLKFELDDASGKTVVTVVDRQTQEVIRQIPDEVALRLARNLQDEQPVNLISTSV
ncbi:flagellar protein FlaG [Hahella sp. SMD15-11]|uniref:Flagellar protein FlaG n=1 Tax=Thermohahella caldifontis TaxID=3142973 RepID=A0AB39UYK6_9GAMM